MNHRLQLYFVAFFALFTVVFSLCSPRDSAHAVTFVPVPEDQYDRNFSSISTEGKRPLGYQKSIWAYNQPNDDDPCIKVSGAANRRIEVMVETHPTARLCVKDQTSGTECSDSGTGRYYRCRESPGNDVYFEFFCDRGEQYDVRFWYRIVLGPTTDEDTEDMWCDSRDQNEYPSSLRRVPADTYQDKPTPLPDASSLLTSCSFLVALGSTVVLILYSWVKY